MNAYDAPRGGTPASNRQALAASAPGWTPRLKLLGIAVPFVVSLVCSYVDLSILLVPWMALLLGVVSAALLRSWWALLVLPIAFTIGTLPGILSSSGAPNVTGSGFIAGATLFVLLALVPLMFGAAIGVPLGRELERLSRAPDR
jgi:hypothetical protein